jgi:uncharacterized protein DUF6152
MGICKSIYWRDIPMRGKLRGILIAAVGLVVAAVPGFAHHGFAVEFDKDRCTDLTGLLSALYWENPHAYFDVDVKEASGTMVTWHLEMITPNALKRNGTTREDFQTNMGKSVSARFCPTKVGGTPYRGTAEFLKLADGQLRIVGQNIENLTPEQIHF